MRHTTVTSVEAFDSFVRCASYGEACVYHTGLIALDRDGPEPERKALDELGWRAMAYSDDGLVELFQKRLGESEYRYIAVRTDKPMAIAAPRPVAMAA